MNNNDERKILTPPRLFSSVTAGFNAVANHVYLIIYPIVLDLLLLFGPRFRVKKLMEPVLLDMANTIKQVEGTDFTEMMAIAQEGWNYILDHFNLLGTLRSYPIGIPSLINIDSISTTPLGNAIDIELSSLMNVLGLWILLSIIGIALGALYFNEVAKHCHTNPTEQKNEKSILWTIGQTFGLTIAFFAILIIVFIPASLILSILTIISPIVAQIAIFFMSFIILWLFIPLVFSPHGIYLTKTNFFTSIIKSAQLVRHTLPITGMFLLIVLLISQGLDLLWQQPPESSWMILVGIAGHAFISTSLIAGSFFYYQGASTWMQERIKIITQIKESIGDFSDKA